MKIVGGPRCIASLSVYMVFLGFCNMDQVLASGEHGKDCVKANFAMAKNDCKNRNRSLFTLSDLKKSIGGQVARNVTKTLKEIWIRSDGNGSCQTLKRSANKTDDDPAFQITNCEDQHHYVCKQNANMEPEYHPACYTKTSPQNEPGTMMFPLVIATVCLLIALAIGIVAVYVIIQRKTRVNASEISSDAGDAQHTLSNPKGDNGCGPQTEGSDTANHDSLAAVEFHGPVDTEEEFAVVVVQCKDPVDVDSLEASPSDVTF